IASRIPISRRVNPRNALPMANTRTLRTPVLNTKDADSLTLTSNNIRRLSATTAATAAKGKKSDTGILLVRSLETCPVKENVGNGILTDGNTLQRGLKGNAYDENRKHNEKMQRQRIGGIADEQILSRHSFRRVIIGRKLDRQVSHPTDVERKGDLLRDGLELTW
ncbi:MAG: hypothetical protein HW412_333, partial [Bacteroidetes bacterium]|nr:hypothetical protein [Bacteroidota bacterium]